MTRKAIALLLAFPALNSCHEAIPIDVQGAVAIPADLAIATLRELLPKAAYASCSDPKGAFMQSEIKSWSVDDMGLEFRVTGKEPFRLPYAAIRGAELSKVPLSYEVRVFAATARDPRKNLFRFNWREEEPARRAAELFESLRGDR